MSENLVYVGKIVQFDPIEKADFIHIATVICGSGGKWRGIVKKTDFNLGDLCTVYLPDSILPPSTDYKFMEESGWRVKMRKFRGAPSEVLIMPLNRELWPSWPIGKDVTAHFGVVKYIKEIPAGQHGEIKGNFPPFIPKTDEPNWQRSPKLLEALKNQPYYITEKADGTSATAYRHKDKFGVCSRNFELQSEKGGVYWEMARKYDLEAKIPEGYALQFEIAGPGIQKNQMRLDQLTGLSFSVYSIENRHYLQFDEYRNFIASVRMPSCTLLESGDSFQHTDLTELARGKYQHGSHREGIVIRSQKPIDGQIISFKSINLDYET